MRGIWKNRTRKLLKEEIKNARELELKASTNQRQNYRAGVRHGLEYALKIVIEGQSHRKSAS